MKYKIFSTLLISFFTTTTFAQTKIAVAIAKQKIERVYCSEFTALPEFEIITGTEVSGTQLKREAVQALKNKYESTYKDALQVDGISNDDEWGNSLIIIAATTPGTLGDKNCKKTTYGVGFGTTEEEALKNAIRRLRSTDGQWKDKAGYKVIKKETYED